MNSKNSEPNYVEWKDWKSSDFGKYSKEESLLFSSEIERAGIILNSNTRILELGFGNGSFAGWTRNFTQFYVGIEANHVLVDRAKNAGFNAFLPDIEKNKIHDDRFFDLIIALDVIEHMNLDDILSTFQAWVECLSENGRIIIRIPSGDSPFSGRLMYGDITHKTLLGTSALRQVASMSGLVLVATYPPTLPIFGLGATKAIERILVSWTRKLVGLLINATFHGNKHGVVTSNLIAVFKKTDNSKSETYHL